MNRERARVALAAIAVALAAALVACSQQPRGDDTPRGSATIGPSGGEVEALGDNGSAYRLSVPPGALSSTVTITLTPRVPAEGELIALELEPHGLVLAMPATLQVTLPAGTPTNGIETFAFGGSAYPAFMATTAAGDRIATELRFFTVPSDGSGTPSGAPAASSLTWRSLAPQQEEGGISVLPADCQRKLEATEHTYDLFFGSETFEAAIRVALNGGALASNCGEFEAVSEFVARIEPAACGRYEELVTNAQVVAADAYEVFTELVQPLLVWSGTLQALGTDCPNVTSLTQVLSGKVEQFIEFYAGQVQDLPPEHDALMAEARKVINLIGQADLLLLAETKSTLLTQVLHPILDMLREAAYAECLENSDHYYLYALFEPVFTSQRVPITPITPAAVPPPFGNIYATFGDDDLRGDVQHCASRLTLEVWADPDVPVELASQRVELEPAAQPGAHETSARTGGPVEGHLVVRGPVEQLRCGQARMLVPHELAIEVNGTELHLSSSLDAVPEIDVRAELQARSLSLSHVNELTIEVVRHISAVDCRPLYGEHHELFEVAYTTDPAPRLNGVTASPAAIPADSDVEVTFALDWFDDGENLKTLRVDYSLGDAAATVVADLASDENATAFSGKQDVGRYTAAHFVHCSEEGKGPLVARFVLVDAYGQETEVGEVSVPVTFGGCDDADGLEGSVM